MRLTVLCDNHTYIDRYYLGEPAFSALIEDGEETVLFDTGYSGVFIENARRLGIDLSAVTKIVLSHGHNDHTGGLAEFFERFPGKRELVAHPAVFLKREYEGLAVGAPVGPDGFGPDVAVTLTGRPRPLSGNAVYLGEIPRRNSFEADRIVGTRTEPDGQTVPDDLKDDTSLALKTKEGLFLLTGCAHAGIANTLAYAKEVTGLERVAGVLGGMHLFETDEAFERTAKELYRLGVRRAWPCHCTSLAVKAAMMRYFETEEVGVGLTLEL